jgi:hypothetical protein
MLGLFRHRVAYLLEKKLSLPFPGQHVEAITGPFMQWCLFYKKIVSEADIAETRQWSAIPVEENDARFLAALRVTFLHRLSLLPEICAAPQAVYMLGGLIDTHWSLILNDSPLPVYMAYASGLEPDGVAIESLVHDSQMVSNDFLENIWHDLQDTMVEPQFKVLWRLLSKGLPRPSSIRYILKSLKFTLSQPTPDEHVVEIVRRFLLGAFQHVTVIAPPAVRMLLFKDDAVEYCLTKMTEMSSKELYIMLSESVISISRHHQALFSLLELRSVWKAYYNQSIAVANEQLRRNWYSVTTACPKPRSPKINIAPAPNRSPAYLVHQAFQRALNSSRYKLPIKIVSSANKAMSLQLVYRLLRRMPTDDMIYPEMLCRIGMTSQGVKMLVNECNLIRNGRIQKQVNRIVGLLSPEDRALLTMCFHYKQMRNSLCIRRLYGVPRRTAKLSPGFVLVCYSCFTIRSQSRGFRKKKTKEGALLDTMVFDQTLEMQGQPICSECKSCDVRAVDVTNHVVRGYSINSPGVVTAITMCTRCHAPTKIAGRIGVFPYCETCLKEAKEQLVAKVCVCRTPIVKGGAPVVLQTDAGCALFGLCTKHIHAFSQHFTQSSIPHVRVVKEVFGIV